MLGLSSSNGLGLPEIHWMPFKKRLARMCVGRLYTLILETNAKETSFVEGFDYAIDAYNESLVYNADEIRKMMGFSNPHNPMEWITLCAHIVLLGHDPKLNPAAPFMAHIKRLTVHSNVAELKAVARTINVDEDTFLKKGLCHETRPLDYSSELIGILTGGIWTAPLSDYIDPEVEIVPVRAMADTLMLQQGYIMRQMAYDSFNLDRLKHELTVTSDALHSVEQRVTALETRIMTR